MIRRSVLFAAVIAGMLGFATAADAQYRYRDRTDPGYYYSSSSGQYQYRRSYGYESRGYVVIRDRRQYVISYGNSRLHARNRPRPELYHRMKVPPPPRYYQPRQRHTRPYLQFRRGCGY